MVDKIFKCGVVALGAAIGYLYGGWSVMLEVVVFLSIADYVTGIIASGVEGKLNSKVGYKGAFRKFMIFTILAVSHFLDRLIGDGNMIMNAAGFFYAGNELLSIIENAGRAGAPVPEVLMRAVAVLKGKSGETSSAAFNKAFTSVDVSKSDFAAAAAKIESGETDAKL